MTFLTRQIHLEAKLKFNIVYGMFCLPWPWHLPGKQLAVGAGQVVTHTVLHTGINLKKKAS